jgi:CubicO group peptidase (beta-lactamase class C family)
MAMLTTRWTRRTALKAGAGLGVAAILRARRAEAAGDWDAVRAAVGDELGGGSALLLVLDRDQVLFREAFGSWPIQVPMLLASASMAPSAAAVLALVDQGALKLDDPVATFIPAFTGEKAAITLRQCLAHTSGIVDPGDLLVPPVKDPGVTLEAEVNAAAKRKLAHRPGAAFAFGGMSYQVAGRVVEIASGTPWELWFKQAIDDPLGVSFTFGETPDPRLAGGASASLDAYGAFLQMILNDGVFNGARVLSKTMIKAMRTNQLRGLAEATPVAEGSAPQRYGLGWWLEEVDHSGVASSMNAAGAFGTVPWIDFAKDYAAIVMMNDKQATGTKLVAKIRPLIEAAIAS